MTEQELLEELCGLLGSGRADNSFVVPALRELSRKSRRARSTTELMGALESLPGLTFEGLASHLRARRRAEAGRCYQRKKAGGDLAEFQDLLGDIPLEVPVGWTTVATATDSLRRAVALLEDCAFLDKRGQATPHIRKTLLGRLQEEVARGGRLIDPQPLIDSLAARKQDPGLREALAQLSKAATNERIRLERQAGDHLMGAAVPFPGELDQDAAADLLAGADSGAATPEARQRALDAACSWPSSRMAPVIRRLGESVASLRERAILVLLLRFNEPAVQEWNSCGNWLRRTSEQDELASAQYAALASEHALELLLLWTLTRPWAPETARAALAALYARQGTRVDGNAFVGRHAAVLPPQERALLAETAGQAAPAKPAVAVVAAAPQPRARPVQPTPPPPAAPAGPSLWDDHVLPFFTANWTMLTGIAMVVVGSSLLAYYTWDKHWLLRYTILPILLGGFTASLARIGDWIEARDATLKGTADMLRGAAVALLPANFMAVALLARDPEVPARGLVLAVFASLYLIAAGRALTRWCEAVHPVLGRLGRTLLMIDALVLLGPLALLVAPSSEWFLFALAAGFHLGFALMAARVVRFLADDLTTTMTEDGRVPWFFAVTLTSTFVQVFMWVHGFMRLLPSAETYACMVIASGGLVLFTERSPLIRKPEDPVYGKNSFMGYAMILFGLLMAAGHPSLRSASLAFAGGLWLAQAVIHRDLLHAWIAFTLLALGGGSIGAWPGFPGPALPSLGVALAVAVGASGLYARRWWAELAGVSAGMQAAMLTATAFTAVLAQWHYQSPPLLAAAVLAAIAGLYAWRAGRDQNPAYVHSAMATLALTLPYLGFADLTGRSLAGNTVVFGLSALSLFWIALLAVRPTPLLLRARSTVLLLYGSLGTAALCLRVYFQQGLPHNVLGSQPAMALGGPVIMTAALVFAAYHSRSLVPMLLAATQAIILMPELKSEITAHFAFIEWGSGLMSALFGAALAAACFPVRSSAALAGLATGGDPFAGGRAFPLTRRDHTLFSWPLMASAIFLLVKVDSWNIVRQLGQRDWPLEATAALLVTGAAWTLVAVYFRRDDAQAKRLVHLGWLSGAAGLGLGYFQLAAAPRWDGAVLTVIAGLDTLYLFYHLAMVPRREWARELLADPLLQVVRAGSVLLSASALAALTLGTPAADLTVLLALSSAHLVWFGLKDGHQVFGSLLFFQTGAALVCYAVPGATPLSAHVNPAACASAGLAFLAAVQLGHAALEASPEAEAGSRPLLAPVFFWATLAVGAAGAYGLLDSVTLRLLTPAHHAVLLALAFAAARGQRSGVFIMLGFSLAYVDVFSGALSAAPNYDARIQALLIPWRLASFGLAAAALGAAGQWVSERRPGLLAGACPLGIFQMPSLPFAYGPALALSALAVALHAANGALRNDVFNLPAPYLAAGTFLLVGRSWGAATALNSAASLFLTLGNIHAVRFYLGPSLREAGLMENHLLCLGGVVTTAQLCLARAAVAREEARLSLNRVALAVSAFVLALLTSTYFVHPDLEKMSPARFVLSAVMAWLAGRSFHRAARRPDPGEEAYAGLWEGAYHFSVTTAIWCLALLSPWLRTPYAAFPALGLPVLYFYLRVELGALADPTVARYRNTATMLSFFLLALYTFRGAFQALLFPGAPIGVEHYHFNAPFIMLLSLVMLRLHGLGGTPWLAFYAGPTMMVGSYFALTLAPGLSPFAFAVPAGWCAIGLGHFWMLASSQPSPVMDAFQRIGSVNDEQWVAHRKSWGLFLLLATQAGLAWALSGSAPHPYAVAPLLLGGASLLAHQAYIRNSRALRRFAGAEGFLALHAGFLVNSYLPAGSVIWALLAVWVAYLAFAEARPEGLVGKAIGRISVRLGVVALAHVLYHGPSSPEGLLAFAAAALLAAITPFPSFQAHAAARVPAMLLIAAPMWLAVFFNCGEGGTWTALVAAAALLATGSFASWVHDRPAPAEEGAPRLYHQSLGLLKRDGQAINSGLLYWVFALAATVQLLHYGSALEPTELALLLGLYAASAAAWRKEGELKGTSAPYFLLEACLLAFLVAVRRQLMLSLNFWNYEFDVWAALLASFILAGAKQALPLAPSGARAPRADTDDARGTARAENSGARAPILGTLLALPAVTLAWVLLHGLGPDMVLVVVGLHTLMFAHMGRGEKESPYHLVAVGGAVAWVLIVFWTKLELRVVQAYVIPVGLGIMTLLQLFRDKIAQDQRNQIRAVTLLAMLSSAGYYALADDRYPVAFHMSLLVLTVFSMTVGSLLKIRLYVLLGFVGLLTDLATLVYKVLLNMDRSARMTLIGGQVLVFGTLLIIGAVVYKTHQERINEMLARWQGELLSWE